MKKMYTTLFVLIVLGIAVATTYTTITIDGINDFESDEDVPGTIGSTYYFTWDATNLYLGLQASEVGSGNSTMFATFYIDSDPQLVPTSGTGTTLGLLYNTQQPNLPFTANYHFRWKADNTYMNLQTYNGSAWVDGNQSNIAAYQSGTYVEFRIPLANIGSPSNIYLVGAMLREQPFNESTFHLTPSGNQVGYDPDFISRFAFPLTTGISPDDPAYVDGIIPVELISFSAITIGSTVKLNWKTATELNNYGFEIERSVISNGVRNLNWEKIGFVNGNGTSNSPKSYSFVDDKVSTGKYSYRLKQIDNDGQFEYSKTIEVDVNGVKEYKLTQNYPNPFNPATTIQYILPQAGMVKLTLYNILGQEIRTLVNEMKEAGTHTINIDASDLNSGMYIYKIESGSFVQTRKMTLVK